jgi:hypothetical protein
MANMPGCQARRSHKAKDAPPHRGGSTPRIAHSRPEMLNTYSGWWPSNTHDAHLDRHGDTELCHGVVLELGS